MRWLLVCTFGTLLPLSLNAQSPKQKPDAGKWGHGTLYILAIGINAYPGNEKLNEAVRDARQVTNTFRKHAPGLFAHVESKVLTDQQATRAGILHGLTWLRQSTKGQDLAVIYYSGHGGMDKKDGFFLWPHGARDNHFKHTTISGQELKAAAGQLACKVLVMLDACDAGGIMRSKPDPQNVVFLCPCRGHEDDREKQNWHHSLLAKVVIDGLSGRADANKDGIITLDELQNYVTQQVKALSKNKQHPVIARPKNFPSLRLASIRPT